MPQCYGTTQQRVPKSTYQVYKIRFKWHKQHIFRLKQRPRVIQNIYTAQNKTKSLSWKPVIYNIQHYRKTCNSVVLLALLNRKHTSNMNETIKSWERHMHCTFLSKVMFYPSNKAFLCTTQFWKKYLFLGKEVSRKYL